MSPSSTSCWVWAHYQRVSCTISVPKCSKVTLSAPRKVFYHLPWYCLVLVHQRHIHNSKVFHSFSHQFIEEPISRYTATNKEQQKISVDWLLIFVYNRVCGSIPTLCFPYGDSPWNFWWAQKWPCIINNTYLRKPHNFPEPREFLSSCKLR